jgi:hypothetical protein
MQMSRIFYAHARKSLDLSFITLYSQLLEIRGEGGSESELTDRKRFIPDATGSVHLRYNQQKVFRQKRQLYQQGISP